MEFFPVTSFATYWWFSHREEKKKKKKLLNANTNQYPGGFISPLKGAVLTSGENKEYTYSFFKAELSRLLGGKNPCCLVELEPGTSGSAV